MSNFTRIAHEHLFQWFKLTKATPYPAFIDKLPGGYWIDKAAPQNWHKATANFNWSVALPLLSQEPTCYAPLPYSWLSSAQSGPHRLPSHHRCFHYHYWRLNCPHGRLDVAADVGSRTVSCVLATDMSQSDAADCPVFGEGNVHGKCCEVLV